MSKGERGGMGMSKSKFTERRMEGGKERRREIGMEEGREKGGKKGRGREG